MGLRRVVEREIGWDFGTSFWLLKFVGKSFGLKGCRSLFFIVILLTIFNEHCLNSIENSYSLGTAQ